ncbi:DUF523 domain-containing protein [Glutamicibacter ectropisis]|uniref:DUF523 domain-containing protein n=1 Tax=Glutamicibacter ectropisis TaxID=3046593 RepID=A0AAU6WEQ5_9MICC
MRKVPILVSSCLAGIPCRYNGKAKTDQNIVNAVARGEAIAACAEELGDLPTPRPPAEIVGGDGYDVLQGNATVVSIDGQDLTEAFVAGAQKVAQLATSNGITEAVLQDRSPSCGCGAIYDGSHSGTLAEGDGVLAAILKQRGLQVSARRGQ